jgi:hypothetical protein|tara:strand:- start:2644 stop:4266 length:1623 start_codon:yes stop_codon:yes gene_type:complete
MKLLDNDFFENYKGGLRTSWVNRLITNIRPDGYKTFEDLYLKTKDGTIITLPPFLQRFLQEVVWQKNEWNKAKSFMTSATTATSMFESFIFVKLDVLISELEQKIIDYEENELLEQLKHAEEALKSLKLSKRKGAKVAQIDGQSRTKLSIVPFFNNKYKITKAWKQNIYDEAGNFLGRYNLQNRFWKDIPYVVQQSVYQTPIYSVVITGGTLDMIVDSLISKQEGEKFTSWQKTYHGRVLSLMGTYINNTIDQPLKDFWSTHINQTGQYNSQQAGLEMFLSKLAYYTSMDTWSGVDTLQKVLDGKNEAPSQAAFETVKKYIDEIKDYYGTLTQKDASKLKAVDVMNYVLFRWHLEKADKKEKHFTQYDLPKDLQINNSNLFVQKFLEMNKQLRAKYWKDENGEEKLNTFSYEEVTHLGKTTIQNKGGGYVGGCSAESDFHIEMRLSNLSEYFNTFLVKKLKDGLIIKFQSTSMPSYEEVEVFNDFVDTRGEIIDQRTGKKDNHRGHDKSKYNDGDNGLKNLKPQPSKDNLEYNKDNLIGV